MEWALPVFGFFILFAAGAFLAPRLMRGRATWPPGAEAAIRKVWCTCYGQTWESRPRVIFIRGKALDCADGKAFRDAWGRCVAGQTMISATAINVAWYEGARWSQTALAHELGHCLDEQDDPFHEGATFAAGGPVARANAALALWESQGA